MAAAPKKNKLVAALVLAGVGAILFVTAGSLLGALFGGVAVAVFGWAMMRPSGTALVGKKCVACGDGLFIEAQSELCPTCNAPLHARCGPTHAKTHGETHPKTTT